MTSRRKVTQRNYGGILKCQNSLTNTTRLAHRRDLFVGSDVTKSSFCLAFLARPDCRTGVKVGLADAATTTEAAGDEGAALEVAISVDDVDDTAAETAGDEDRDSLALDVLEGGEES